MKSGILKYQIGIGVIGVFTLTLLIIVLTQAGGTKQDAVTAKAANTIANDLNNYISSRETVPESLDQINAGKVPSTITYTKLSTTTYQFCVTYKSASSGFDAGNTFTDVVTRGAYGGSYTGDNYDYGSSGYLYLSPTHKKGKNCQTVNTDGGYGGGYVPLHSSGGSIQDEAKDTERQTDLKALQGQLEAYFAENGRYPSSADLGSNSASNVTFIHANMKGLDNETLRDPQAADGDYSLASAATAHKYAYIPGNDSGGSVCNDSGTNDCTYYTLVATYSDGSDDTVYSLN